MTLRDLASFLGAGGCVRVLALVACFAPAAHPLVAQDVGPAEPSCAAAPEASASPPSEPGVAAQLGGEGRSSGLFGRAPERRRIIPGLFVTHPFYHFPEVTWTRGGGIQASTWFLAGFMNSYDRFSMILGVERTWLEGRSRRVRFGLGYRAGLLTGYDERLLALARHTPALPFAGLLAWADLGGVGLDVFYVYKAVTIEGSFGF